METRPRELRELVEGLAALLAIPPPVTNNRKAMLSWSVTPSHELQFSTTGPDRIVTCILGKLPESNREDFYLFLMRANFLGQGTNGHVLGMDREEKYLTLSSKIPYDLGIREFKDYIENFVNFVDYWRGELIKHVTQTRGPFG